MIHTEPLANWPRTVFISLYFFFWSFSAKSNDAHLETTIRSFGKNDFEAESPKSKQKKISLHLYAKGI